MGDQQGKHTRSPPNSKRNLQTKEKWNSPNPKKSKEPTAYFYNCDEKHKVEPHTIWDVTPQTATKGENFQKMTSTRKQQYLATYISINK